MGRDAQPSAGCLDRLAVQTTDSGDDAGKTIQGRKRQLVVATLGLIHGLVVNSANIQDRNGAEQVLEPRNGTMPRLERVWTDSGSSGHLETWVAAQGRELTIIPQDPDATGFQVLPQRGIIERTFARLGTCRRLSNDDEHRVAPSEAMIRLAMIGLMVRCLRPAACPFTHVLTCRVGPAD